MAKYIIGVDGGNTKTDYMLFDTDGNYLNGLRSGTCSHESPKVGGFEQAYLIMKENLEKLINSQGLNFNDIDCAVFGLAGIDAPFQKEALTSYVAKLGFKKFIIANDGFLGIKAASPNGTGVCTINGTGTVSVGIDEYGNTMQVGGIGHYAGDDGGGNYLAREAVRSAYSECFRFGPKTVLTNKVMEMYGIKSKDELQNSLISKPIVSNFLTIELFNAANCGDAEAIRILRASGTELGLNACGVINELKLKSPINIFLAGGVWAHLTNNEILDAYKEVIKEKINQECVFNLLTLPPVLGAILWAIEVSIESIPSISIKNKVLKEIEIYNQNFK